MKWGRLWPSSLLTYILLFLYSPGKQSTAVITSGDTWTEGRKQALRYVVCPLLKRTHCLIPISEMPRESFGIMGSIITCQEVRPYLGSRLQLTRLHQLSHPTRYEAWLVVQNANPLVLAFPVVLQREGTRLGEPVRLSLANLDQVELRL